MASSSSSSRKEHFEAGKRRLEEFRKKKAEERAKKVSSSSTNKSQLSELNNIEQPSAGGLNANTPELNGIFFENKPLKDSRDSTSAVVQPSLSVISTLPLSRAGTPLNEIGTPEIFVQQNVEVKASAAEPIHTENASSNSVSGAVYNNRLHRPSYDDTRGAQRQDIASFSEGNSGYKNSWRRLSCEHISELANKPEAESANYESFKSGVVPSKFHSDKPECGDTGIKDAILSSQAENFRDVHLGERNGRGDHSLKELIAEAQDPSRSLSSNAQENSQHSGLAQRLAHRSSLLAANEAGGNSQLDRHTGSIHMKSNIFEPTFGGKPYSPEPAAFGNGAAGEGETKDLGKGSELHLPHRNNNRHWQNQDSFSAQYDFNSKIRPSTTLFSTVKSDFPGCRMRPSFLDSITSSTTSTSATVRTSMLGKETSTSLEKSNQTEGGDTEEPSFVRPWQSANAEEGIRKKSGIHDRVPSQIEFSSSEKNDDFAALEQHIEDLTQEKFALQRALDASRTLAESLAQENSSLTEDFNQQGAVVSQLKADLERQQEEIRAQLLVLNTLKIESENAHLECSAADERAKILASEVIGLEEKALRLRSNELKLERQLETVNGEIASYKRHFSSLEKDRSDLRSTIDALQEEKKLLQSKLRKAAVSESFDVHKTSKHLRNIKDASTSTEDIGFEVCNFPVGGGILVARQDNATASTSTSETLLTNVNVNEVSDVQLMGVASSTSSNFSLSTDTTTSLNSNQRIPMPDLPVAIPRDQQRMVDNINSLIEELALEKEAFTRALRAESEGAAKLRATNQELTQKLEAQTQRLELLIAQNMVHEASGVGPRDFESVHDEIDYVDEGDEVVERVLGWIMKLFPGGSSKRRTSKLL